MSLDPKQRKDVRIDQVVEVVQKQHQRTGELTEGIVEKLLTKSSYHPHGIKVRLEDGTVGRVQNIIEDSEL